MELKTARLTLLIDPNKKAAFERLCAKQDRTASQVVRQFIRDYLAMHDVQYVPSGSLPKPTDPAGGMPRHQTNPRLAGVAPVPTKRPAARRKA